MEQQAAKQASKKPYGPHIALNGLLALILGCIAMAYRALTKTYSSVKWTEYRSAVNLMYAASDRLAYLAILGAVLFVLGIILCFIQPAKTNPVVNKVLWFVPMALIILFAVINYIPIFKFAVINNSF